MKVHFLYGSRPSRKWKDTEPKWFGGILGGHVGVEVDNDKVLNFLHHGKFHLIAARHNRHSIYAENSVNKFYAIFGNKPDSAKKAIVFIPINTNQKQKFDSLSTAYLKETPYDYALIGMRCGAATYDILGQLNILPKYSYGITYRKIFYPRKLRKRLFKMANKNGWAIVKYKGSGRRKWEHD